ncbi:MAG: hypothetical protein V4506_09390 [Bacteroidota bacterium]
MKTVHSFLQSLLKLRLTIFPEKVLQPVCVKLLSVPVRKKIRTS